MIAHLAGKIIEKDASIVVDVGGVGYEIFCPQATLAQCGAVGELCSLFVHTQYRAENVSLYGFGSRAEKDLFLLLIKVDSVGPKSALQILSAAPWQELVHLINDGDVSALAKLPKISKKTAEHLVVKLKGKLDSLCLEMGQAVPVAKMPARQLRQEVQTALQHLGFKPHDVDRTLSLLSDDVWEKDMQGIIRQALSEISRTI